MPDKFTETKTEPMTDDQRLDKFILDISRDANTADDQRDDADEDMRFVNDSNGQWEGWQEDLFHDRVRLQMDVLSNYLERFIGEWNNNRTSVEYKPNDRATTDEDAELLTGLYRSDFRQFGGSQAVDNAVREAATCGYGAFKLATKLEDDEDIDNENQRIIFRSINNAYSTTYWDVSAQDQNKSDARYCTELKEFTRDSFLAQYPEENPVSAYTPASSTNSNTRFDRIFIATRYEVIKKKSKVFIYNNLGLDRVERYLEKDHKLIEDELKQNKLMVFVKEGTVNTRFVEKTVFSGDKILDPTRRIAGKIIPIIPVYARRGYVGGRERYYGLITKLKDAQRLLNVQISQLAENAASSGQAVPIFNPKQMTGQFEADWADKNNKPFLTINPAYDGDNLISAGPVGYVQPQPIDPSTQALMQTVPDYIRSVTGGSPQDTLDPNASGKAINAIIKRENLNTQSIMDNIATAITWSGECYQGMAAEVYTTQRMIRVLGADGRDKPVILFEVITDEETGKQIEVNTLSGKKFAAYADVGPQYDTLREQSVEDMKGMLEILSKIPGQEKAVQVLVASILENTSGVGLDAIKKLNRIEMLKLGLVDPEDEEESQIVTQAQQPRPDPQSKLLEAASKQQEAEARNLDSKSLSNTADASKKQAETQQIISETEIDRNQAGLDAVNVVSLIQERRSKIIEQARSGL